MKQISLFIILFAICGGVRAGQLPEKYAAIYKKNIFMKGRPVERHPDVLAGREQVSSPPAPVDPRTFFVLKGIACEKGCFTAFFENVITSEVFCLKGGEMLEGGKIAISSLESIEYKPADDSVVSIAIGSNLLGSAGEKASGPAGATQGSPEGSDAAGAGSSDDEAEVIRKMMERRKQQMQ